MSTPIDFPALIAAASGRSGLRPLLEALGFEAALEPIPADALHGYGLADAPVGDVVLAGRAGSLDALLLELDGRNGRPAALAARVRARNPARLHLFLIAGAGYRTLTLGAFGLDGTYRYLALDRARVRASDLATLGDMAPAGGEDGLELALRQSRALDRSGITRRFFQDFRVRRDAIASAWLGLPAAAERERRQLSLLFLSRLTFLYFLQRRGALGGDDRYLARLFGRWRPVGQDAAATFFRARLQPLFFGALNRRPEDRDDVARRLGDLPYLNGGLFERHALEREYPGLDLCDEQVAACFDDLLERYRFTAGETVRDGEEGVAHGVDPEVLGRVFEGLMAPTRRGETGSFYTPAPVVNRVVREALVSYLDPTCSESQARAVVHGDAGSLPLGTRYRVRRALERVRVLDPACGSGAFLLGALERLARSLDPLVDRPIGDIRRDVVARSLHGVDLLDDAALLCALRLWLALSVGEERIRPLPNLDRRIRQGDALVDPLDLGRLDVPDGEGRLHPLRDPHLRRAIRAVGPAARRYLSSGPEDRDRLRTELRRAEQRLARRWIEAARRAEEHQLRGLRARAQDRDLFGEAPAEAVRARQALVAVDERVDELDTMRVALDEDGALPFFSFGVHFADAGGGFDMILSNPPWVRSHRWPDRLRRLCARYEVCRDPGWRRAAALTGAPAGAGSQVDLSLLFVERCLRLLAPGGVLAILLPAKALRALYGGSARRMMLRDLDLALIEDHALDHRSLFQADTFAALLIGRKRLREQCPDGVSAQDVGPAGLASEATASDGIPWEGNATGRAASADGSGNGARDGTATRAGDSPLRIRIVRRGATDLEFRTTGSRLPLFPDDPSSPWLLAPPEVVDVFRAMQAAGPPLGEHAGMRVRRGIMTGANDVLLFTDVRPKLAGLAEVEAAGYGRARKEGRSGRHASRFRGVVELDGLRPLVRGADIDAFRYTTETWVAWCHGPDGRPAEPPRRLAAYLDGHDKRLRDRSGWRPGRPTGTIFRIGPHTLQPKVAWHDLSDTLRAVALPATIPTAGSHRELIPLNTVYFLPALDEEAAHLVAGLLNGLPLTAMARAIAERAKDARFRFFAWTVSALPLPRAWRTAPAAETIRRISRSAHAAGGISAADRERLDTAVAALYGLGSDQLDELRRYDRWLKGES